VTRRDKLGKTRDRVSRRRANDARRVEAVRVRRPGRQPEHARDAQERPAPAGGGSPIHIEEDDLVVYDTEYQSSCATVVLLDMSGSMARYGKYGQAKKVALAMQALVRGGTREIFCRWSASTPTPQR